MKQDRTPARRAAWLLLAAPALLVTPAYAQDTPQTAPPPVQRTVPDAPAPVTQAAPTPTTDTTSTTSRTTIAPGAREVVDEARIAAQRAAPARQASRAPARAMRTVTTRTTTARAPAAAAPVAAPAPAPVAAAPATDPIAPPPATDPVAPTANDATAPVEAPVAADTRTTTTETGGAPLWPLVLIAGLIILAGAGYAMWSRRRRAQAELYEAEPAYYEEPVAYAEPVEEPAYVAPVAAAAPIAAAPLMARDTATDVESVAAEDATLTEAEAEEVAALTGGTAPVSNRPWLEFAMRPVRAGTSADEAVVEIELTVANSGSQAARNVRVSAFMLSDREATDMERLLLDRPGDAAVDPVTIEPGEGARIDATLAALKADIGEEGAFSPVVIADARYTLPDGSEGRTFASFVVGITREGGEISPIDLADRVMREDIEARLHGQPQHA
ncbi:hypothetical protein M9980_08165 [Sphingomonas donggukensis]|uniref:LPXTG cell wall anchor domain-containing protein n=1 Tax=Sphingomonas donggukensis TaxID=2949093 RepID=A0ABY4TQ99_9SPHN|nr:hypothetical protein [Sphingomonas donggukensis]URW74552.1 hypothetical protein M9980_08165 [Sphingomonas donggukensis]